jgi:uncharacterized protein YjbI with pentapeptide repeats
MSENVIIIGLAVLATLLLAIVVWWLWWRLPKREVARLSLKIRDPKARADVEDNYRKTVGQALGGIAVLLGAGLAYLQFSQQQRASHDLLISNQVSKGFEQLGSEKVVIRLGGIYALEGVMNNSDQYHQAVLEALSAFVREGTRASAAPMLPRDIQAALTVIGTRSAGAGVVDLTKANIAGADLTGAYLTGADLTGASLIGANLTRAYLTRAYLIHADLAGAYLANANLAGAFLIEASLAGATLTGADLTGADLARAKLTVTDLTGANLTDVDLTGVDLTGVDLDGQKQLDEACGSRVVLPTRLTLRPCPP